MRSAQMKKSLLTAFLLQAATVASASTVEFSPNSDDWGVMSTATGTVAVSDKVITVALDDYTMTANPKYPGERKIVGYTVCLAYRKSDDVWDTAACARQIKHRTTLGAGQSESIGASTFTIPTNKLSSLEGFWLVLRVQIARSGGGVGHAFSDSQKDVFAGTPVGSRESAH